MRADPLRRATCRQHGFTLLEVMVALAVIAFALAAAVSAVSGNTRNAAGLQQRTYAHWVAMNKMAELQISQQWPATHPPSWWRNRSSPRAAP